MQGLGRARGRGVGVGAVGAGMLGKHVAVAAAGFPISGGFRGAGWGFPKAKVPYMGTTGWCRTHPRWPGTAWGGCRKFSEIAGNCRQLPIGPMFQSWPGVPELGSLVLTFQVEESAEMPPASTCCAYLEQAKGAAGTVGRGRGRGEGRE